MNEAAAERDPSVDPPLTSRPTLQGMIPPTATAAERRAALDQAFDYRGDVTIELADGEPIEGYVFDRRANGDAPYVRVMLKATGERVTVPYDRVAGLRFTGRDTAHGKTWETWVKKFAEKKLRGERAEMLPDDRE